MELVVYGGLCPAGEERKLAYRLLALALEREAGGKPFFPGFPQLQFNLSHSRGAAVCALHHLPVGVDVERLRQPPRRLAAGLGDEAFFRLWTAKEATVKLAGQGIAALLELREPDRRCQCLEDFLPGWIVTLCPTEPGPVRTVRVENPYERRKEP